MIRFSRSLGGLLLVAGACMPAFSQGPDVWMKLYNEKDFDGWKGKMTIWKVDTGAMMTGTGALTANTFLVTDTLFNDFHLKVEGRMPGSGGYRNSGVIYRGKVLNTTNYEVSGYQYELSDGGTGAFYHERGNELGFTGGCGGGGNSSWKQMEVIANGPKVTHKLNGANCFEHSTFKILEKGIIGLQLHNPGNFTVNFRNVFIKPLNNSFQVPADNAWDGNGKKIGTLGTIIRAKRNRIEGFLEVPAAMAGFDIRGKALPRALMNRSPAILVISR